MNGLGPLSLDTLSLEAMSVLTLSKNVNTITKREINMNNVIAWYLSYKQQDNKIYSVIYSLPHHTLCVMMVIVFILVIGMFIIFVNELSITTTTRTTVLCFFSRQHSYYKTNT